MRESRRLPLADRDGIRRLCLRRGNALRVTPRCAEVLIAADVAAIERDRFDCFWPTYDDSSNSLPVIRNGALRARG